MKKLKAILKDIAAVNAREPFTTQDHIRKADDLRLLQCSLVDAAQSHLLDLEELVAVLKSNAVEVDYQGEYVFGYGKPAPEKRLAVLPGDVDALENLR